MKNISPSPFGTLVIVCILVFVEMMEHSNNLVLAIVATVAAFFVGITLS